MLSGTLYALTRPSVTRVDQSVNPLTPTVAIWVQL